MTRAEWLASLKTGDRVVVRDGWHPDAAAEAIHVTPVTRTPTGRLHLEGYGRLNWADGSAYRAGAGHRHIAPLPEVE